MKKFILALSIITGVTLATGAIAYASSLNEGNTIRYDNEIVTVLGDNVIKGDSENDTNRICPYHDGRNEDCPYYLEDGEYCPIHESRNQGENTRAGQGRMYRYNSTNEGKGRCDGSGYGMMNRR